MNFTQINTIPAFLNTCCEIEKADAHNTMHGKSPLPSFPFVSNLMPSCLLFSLNQLPCSLLNPTFFLRNCNFWSLIASKALQFYFVFCVLPKIKLPCTKYSQNSILNFVLSQITSSFKFPVKAFPVTSLCWANNQPSQCHFSLFQLQKMAQRTITNEVFCNIDYRITSSKSLKPVTTVHPSRALSSQMPR